MSKNTSVVIGPDQDRFIRKQIRKGSFGSASEAVRAGLRLLEEQELRTERLRQALASGEASGPATAFDIESFVLDQRRKAL